MAVYDEEKNKTLPSDDELRRATGINDTHERQAYSGAAQDILDREHQAAIGGQKDSRPDLRSQEGLHSSGAPDLAKQNRDAEQQNASHEAAAPDSDLRENFDYDEEQPRGVAKIKANFNNLSKKKKTLFLAGGVGIGALAAGAIVLIFLISSLLIPNFAQDVLGYQFARVTQEGNDGITEATAENVALSSESDAGFQQAEGEFGTTTTDPVTKTNVFTKINNYRPQKVVDNLKANGQLQFEYSQPSKLLGRRTLQKIVIKDNDGAIHDIPVPETNFSLFDKLTNPFGYAKALYQSGKLVDTALDNTLNTTIRGTNYYVRSRVAKAIAATDQVQYFRWTNEEVQESNNETPETADINQAKDSFDIATNGGEEATIAEQGSNGQEQEASQQAETAEEACLQQKACTQKIIDSGGGFPDSVLDVFNKFFNPSVLNSIIKAVSITYLVAVPLCQMYQASMPNSGGIIKANTQEVERTGGAIMAAADQQKAGEGNDGPSVTGELIGAQARQMGSNSDVAQSNAEVRLSGLPAPTNGTGIDPEADGAGGHTYDEFDFLGAGADAALRHVIVPVCNVFTNPWTGVLTGLATLIVPGITEALDGAADLTLSQIVGLVTRNIVTNIGNMFSKTELAKAAAIGGVTFAASMFAKYIALQHMGGEYNGTARNVSYDNQGDAGINVYAQKVDQQQNYAAPMTAAGTAQTESQAVGYLNQQQQAQSTFERYFAVNNPTSLVTRIGTTTIAHMDTSSLWSFIASGAKIFNPLTAFSNVFSLFQNKSIVDAATNTDIYNYGNVQFGWTPIEEYHYEHDANYSMLVNQKNLVASGQEVNIDKNYSKCFTNDISDLLSQGDIQESGYGQVEPDTGDCAPDNLGPTNQNDTNVTDKLTFKNTTAQLVFMYRVAMRNQTALQLLTDTQNVTASTAAAN